MDSPEGRNRNMAIEINTSGKFSAFVDFAKNAEKLKSGGKTVVRI